LTFLALIGALFLCLFSATTATKCNQVVQQDSKNEKFVAAEVQQLQQEKN
jgi:hypothetical protein